MKEVFLLENKCSRGAEHSKGYTNYVKTVRNNKKMKTEYSCMKRGTIPCAPTHTKCSRQPIRTGTGLCWAAGSFAVRPAVLLPLQLTVSDLHISSNNSSTQLAQTSAAQTTTLKCKVTLRWLIRHNNLSENTQMSPQSKQKDVSSVTLVIHIGELQWL